MSFYVSKKTPKTQPFTPLELEQQNVKYCILRFKLLNNGGAERGERKLRSDFVGLVGRDSILHFFDLRIISFKECS